jgi:hypothetical protein
LMLAPSSSMRTLIISNDFSKLTRPREMAIVKADLNLIKVIFREICDYLFKTFLCFTCTHTKLFLTKILEYKYFYRNFYFILFKKTVEEEKNSGKRVWTVVCFSVIIMSSVGS